MSSEYEWLTSLAVMLLYFKLNTEQLLEHIPLPGLLIAAVSMAASRWRHGIYRQRCCTLHTHAGFINTRGCV